MAAEVRVLSLNVWGVRFIAKFIDQRLQALVEHFKDPKNEYDIVGLQEVRQNFEFSFCFKEKIDFSPFVFFRFGAKKILNF